MNTFLDLNVFIVCLRNTEMFKSIPLMCTHVYSYMFSTVHPREHTIPSLLKTGIFGIRFCRHIRPHTNQIKYGRSIKIGKQVKHDYLQYLFVERAS